MALKVLEQGNNPNYTALQRNMVKEIEALNAVGDHPYIMKIVNHGFDKNWTHNG